MPKTSYTIDNFDKEFITELFLESDSVASINRLVVAVANVVNENNENNNLFTELLSKEQATRGSDDPADTPTISAPKRKKKFSDKDILNFTDEEYRDKFKMKRSTVQALITYLKDFIKPGGTIISLEKKVHVFLWILTSYSSYSEIGTLFGLHKSSVAYIFQEISTILAEQRYTFITWPTVEEQHITRIKVNSRFNFPNCVGFIDTCRFKIGAKKNKKKTDTILLQAVCDESLAFIDIEIGEVGIIKKSKVFRETKLSQELKNFIEFDNHILGDSEYKLRKNLITPFTSDEVLTNEEMKFNEIHWKARSYIGHAFELLKERFRKLNQLDINKPELVAEMICAACVLHNFTLIHEGCPEVKNEPIVCDDGVIIDTDIVQTAQEKRQFLCNYINYIDGPS